MQHDIYQFIVCSYWYVWLIGSRDFYWSELYIAFSGCPRLIHPLFVCVIRSCESLNFLEESCSYKCKSLFPDSWRMILSERLNFVFVCRKVVVRHHMVLWGGLLTNTLVQWKSWLPRWMLKVLLCRGLDGWYVMFIYYFSYQSSWDIIIDLFSYPALICLLFKNCDIIRLLLATACKCDQI